MVRVVSGNPEPVEWWVVQSFPEGDHHSTHLTKSDADEVRAELQQELQRPFQVVRKVLK